MTVIATHLRATYRGRSAPAVDVPERRLAAPIVLCAGIGLVYVDVCYQLVLPPWAGPAALVGGAAAFLVLHLDVLRAGQVSSTRVHV